MAMSPAAALCGLQTLSSGGRRFSCLFIFNPFLLSEHNKLSEMEAGDTDLQKPSLCFETNSCTKKLTLGVNTEVLLFLLHMSFNLHLAQVKN